MTKTIRTLLWCLMLLGFQTAIAVAEDFTFIIPVQITNLHPDITKGRVSVWVTKFKSASPVDPVKCGGIQEFDIVGGNYNNSLTMKFNAPAGSNPADAHYWSCNMDLYSVTLGWRPAGFQFDIYAAGGPYKFDNVNSVLNANGSIP
ncbi:MAG TPA: hypothetical protein VN371_07165 [Chlorobaculum sp.]|nr:hypothetical protein [Chlorobaculum sp.]